MRRIFFVNIGIVLLSTMVFVIPANAGLFDKLKKNVEDVTKGVNSVLNQVQKGKERVASQEEDLSADSIRKKEKSHLQKKTPEDTISDVPKSSAANTSESKDFRESKNIFSQNKEIGNITKPLLDYCATYRDYNSYSDCECMLKQRSDKIRDNDKKELQKLEEELPKLEKKALNTVMPKSKIDAVCKLCDSVSKHSELADSERALGNTAEYQFHEAQRKNLLDQIHELLYSYFDNNNQSTRGNITSYCYTKYGINRIKKDLEEDDGILYPSVKRELTLLSQIPDENASHDISTGESMKYYRFLKYMGGTSKRFVCLQTTSGTSAKKEGKDPQEQKAVTETRQQSTTPEPYQHNSKAQQSELVRQIQQGLIELGYGMVVALEDEILDPKAAGYMSSGTRMTIEYFQRDKGLEVDGKADNELLENINKFLGQQYISEGNTYTFSPSPIENASVSKASNEFSDVIATHPEAKSVYEECTSNKDFRNSIDCQCLAVKFAELRSKGEAQPNRSILIAQICQRGCQNVQAQMQIEYEQCMQGSGFKHEGFPQEEYCKCYAETYGNLLGEYEGKINATTKGYMKRDARNHCGRPSSYKIK